MMFTIDFSKQLIDWLSWFSREKKKKSILNKPDLKFQKPVDKAILHTHKTDS